MAGDWIKAEHTLPDKPEVVAMASMLDIDQDAVVGKLLRLWIWADQQFKTETITKQSCNGMTVTKTFIDRVTLCNGFTEALRSVGWLTGTDGHLILPNFDRHNGTTAKERASTYRRVKESRARNGNVTDKPLQKALTIETETDINTIEKKENPVAVATAADSDSHTVPFAFCVNLGVTDIELGGKCLEYHEDPVVWEAEFIRRWNKLPRVSQRMQGSLDHTLQKALQQRLLDSSWKWQQAFAMFPIEMDIDFTPNLTWFFKPDTVSKILDKSFRKTKRAPSKKSVFDISANLKAFAEGGTNEQSVFESSRFHGDGGIDDGGVPEGNAGIAD
jgi:hypothetical protein